MINLKVLLSALFLLLPNLLLTQIGPEWVRTYNGTYSLDDGAGNVVVDNVGNIYVCGFTFSPFTGNDFLLLKYNSGGAQLWARSYNSDDNVTHDKAASIEIDKNSNIYVSGNSTYNNRDGYKIIKCDSDGKLLWSQQYLAPNNVDFNSKGMAIDDSGNIYFTGDYWDGNNNDIITVKYSSTGLFEWMKRYDGAVHGFDFAYGIETDNEGNAYVVGFSDNQNLFDALIIKYNSKGDSVWIRKYQSPPGASEGFTIKVSDEYLYVGGYQGDGGFNRSFLLLKYNLLGERQWASSENAGQLTNLSVDDAGNIYCLGHAFINPFISTMKYNSSGIRQWIRSYSLQSEYIIASSLLIDNYSNVYVTANIDNLKKTDILTIKYNNQGTQHWEHRFMSIPNGSDFGTGNAVDQNDNVYVVGVIYSETDSSDAVTIKYSNVTSVPPHSSEIPKNFILYQNYPNPFNPITKITYSVPTTSDVTINVFDASGKLIKTLVKGNKPAGNYTIEFDGSSLASGIYLCKIESNGFTDCKKMVLIK